jgi:hypothetical protein
MGPSLWSLGVAVICELLVDEWFIILLFGVWA